ncbi:hypothetical protein BG20_I0891 [Candidatus Nitrosarchaeum limnium BG20]|jgi:hypothetical protein|uniref:Uncharacterized protein n=2 Tax=Nitrosarchaeum TaxID=1007082 RepID=S2EJU1_9ARCH|nr:hypothetical protein BG20_I0891 [Candidatus Nitrosarchaeum limnium BG20]
MFESLMYTQSLDLVGLILEIIGFLMLVPQLVQFLIKINPELRMQEVKKSFKRFLFAFGIGFFIIGLLMQLLSILVEL